MTTQTNRSSKQGTTRTTCACGGPVTGGGTSCSNPACNGGLR